MKKLTLAIALLSAVCFAQAATHEHPMTHDVSTHDMSSHDMQAHAATYQGMGVVKAIKSDKVQIAHQAIPSLQWPPMTMWFSISDYAGHNIKVGDSVHFEMMQNDNKQWMIVAIKRN